MDLNELLYHHQIALMTVTDAAKSGRKLPNFDLPSYYSKRINDYRKTRGLSPHFVKGIQISPAAELARDSEFAPAVAISMQSALIADMMIAEILVTKNINQNSDTAPDDDEQVFLGDILGDLGRLQNDVRDVSRRLMNRLMPDPELLTPLKASEFEPVESWENEGGNLGDRAKPTPPPRLNIHDLRASEMRAHLAYSAPSNDMN